MVKKYVDMDAILGEVLCPTGGTLTHKTRMTVTLTDYKYFIYINRYRAESIYENIWFYLLKKYIVKSGLDI